MPSDRWALGRCGQRRGCHRTRIGSWNGGVRATLVPSHDLRGSAQDRELFQEAVAALTLEQSGEQPVESPLARAVRWRTLAVHGEVESALKILDQFDPESAAMVSIDGSRIDHAFEVLGFPLEEVDQQITTWVDAAIERQRESESEELVQSVNDLLALVHCLIVIGREDAARTAVGRLCRTDLNVGQRRLRDYVLYSLLSTRRSDWVVEFAIADDEKTLSPTSRGIVARLLPDSDAISLEIILEALRSISPADSEQDRLVAACTLIEGQIPDGFDPLVDFKRLYDFAVVPRYPGRGVAVQGTAAIRANLNIVRLFARHGQAEYASGLLEKLIEFADLEALRQLAEQQLDGGSSEAALELFETMRQSISGAQTAGRFGVADGDLITVQSLIGTWTVAKRLGDYRAAEELLNEIRLALCSPSTRLQQSVAEYLTERNEQTLATEVFENLLPNVMFDNQERTGIYDVARSYSLSVRQSKADQAARWFDLAICEIIASQNYRPGAYITLPLYVHRWSVEAAIERKDEQAISLHLDRIMQLDPLDIDMAERILPNMREAGFAPLADQALDRILEVGIRYTQQFPLDAMTANNLAWVAAMNGRHLDVALELSEQAVYQAPESAIYRDTLAEILFRIDRKQEALQVEEACLFDDPTQWHLHQQVEKYRAAIDDGPS